MEMRDESKSKLGRKPLPKEDVLRGKVTVMLNASQLSFVKAQAGEGLTAGKVVRGIIEAYRKEAVRRATKAARKAPQAL